ncbi:hypothetical protein ACLB2K_024409 [Fragaria x ananassa]
MRLAPKRIVKRVKNRTAFSRKMSRSSPSQVQNQKGGEFRPHQSPIMSPIIVTVLIIVVVVVVVVVVVDIISVLCEWLRLKQQLHVFQGNAVFSVTI